MSQALAFANGWNLATTLMVCVVVFHADTGNYGVMLAAEYDGDPGRTSIVRQLRIVLDQAIEERLHVALIGRRLKRPWLPLDRQNRNGERLLHQVQVAPRELRHAAHLDRHFVSRAHLN